MPNHNLKLTCTDLCHLPGTESLLQQLVTDPETALNAALHLPELSQISSVQLHTQQTILCAFPLYYMSWDVQGKE